MTPGWGQEVDKSAAEVPSSVSAEIQEVLGAESLQVTLDGELVAEFWMREEIPLGEPSSELGFNFSNIGYGILLGVVRLPQVWKDYKDLPIQAGVYTLRYGQQPADGNHMGVAAYRDYLLLVPVSEDQELNTEFNYGDLNYVSKMATATPHPAVMALFPIWEEVSTPALVKNEMDQWTLVCKIGELTLGLVVEGHGELEGY